MVVMWQTINKWGTPPGLQEQQHRAVLLTNRLAAILFLLNLLFVFVIVLIYSWSLIAALVLFCSLAPVSVLLLNRWGLINSSRLLLCLSIPISTLCITLLFKTLNQSLEEISYFTSRTVLLIGASLPIIVFQFKERRYLIITMAVSALCLIFYDVIHNLFGVGYYQKGFDAVGYNFFGLVVIILYALMMSSFMFYKSSLEKIEQDLRDSNRQLYRFYNELGEQHQEIQAQTKKLQESQRQLREANSVIEQQKGLLEAENLELHQHLLEKNKILEASNRELHKRLDELQQFSYTISHNLRGPVANLLGLASLFTPEGENPKNHQIMAYTRTAAAALDTVIRDLSQVLQVREGKEASETINLAYLLENVLISVKKEQGASQVQVEKQLEVKELQGVKAYVHSIFYNLISNALKYSHSQRNCKIEICSRVVKEGVLLQVKDNGIGIDLEKHGKDLFKMYKRFNENYDGRGLGLYLIKTQAEVLGGYVDVQSKPGEGTCFQVWLPYYTSAIPDRVKDTVDSHKSR